MKQPLLIALVGAALACSGSGDPPAAGTGGTAGQGGAGPPGGGSGGSLADLVRQYEAGTITRTDFGSKLADFPGSARAEALKGTLDEIVLLRARAFPYTIAADMAFGGQGVLLVEAGASISISAGVTVDIKGKLYVLGTAARPVTIAGASKAAAYKTIALSGGRSEIVGAVMRHAQSLVTVNNTMATPVVIQDSKLDDFYTSGIEMAFADALLIKGNKIGVETKPEDAGCEAIHGTESAVRIEGNVFGKRTGYNDVFDLQPCSTPHNPIIIGNKFLGGDDDAIDLDDCDAIIIGNHLTSFRPGATAVGMANGGGITGAGGNAVVIGNFIENCLHAIGFKDDARPLILNNTIVGNDVGITIYSSGVPPAASGVAINNILWNNKTDIILNGSWFPAYNPTTLGSLEASHNVVKDPEYAGKNENLGSDPLLDVRDGVPGLRAGSPARGSGLGDVAFFATKTIFAADRLKAWMDSDLAGTTRPSAGGKFTAIDRGAVQNR